MALPRSIGKYEILDALGAGGMGTVYRGFDPTLERMVAIKIVHLERVADIAPQDLAERFRNEARAVARLSHPGIVTIFDYDDQDPVGAYIAMEYVRGCGLDAYVQQRERLHLEDAVSAVQQTLGALAYAHRQGVIHRDIKPSNLLITREGLVKITDFGIAKISARAQTQTGMLVGTPQYMAPEQYMGGVIDQRCDVHAAGAVLHELLTGAPPYTGTAAQVMYQVCYETPKPVSAADATIPKVFDAIVAQALAKRAADRFASAEHFQQALTAAWQSQSPKPLAAALSPGARAIAAAVSRQPATPPPLALTPAPRASPPPAPSAPERAAPPAAAAPPARPATGGRPAAGNLTREQLAEVESQLMPLLGPVTPILVRDAAATTATKQELYQLLATHLHSPEERRRFLLGGEHAPAGAATRPGAADLHADSGLIAGRPLTPEATQRAGQLLARYLGPVAAFVTRQAAQAAADEAQLYSLLAEKVHDAGERERFLSEAKRPH